MTPVAPPALELVVDQGAAALAPAPILAPVVSSSSLPSARARAILELAKPRITRLVTLTSAVGFVLSATDRAWSAGALAWAALGCVVGTALSSGGANALNQCMEVRRDGLMRRTAHRPLPSQRLSPSTGLAAGLALCGAGLAVLCLLCGPAAATVSALSMLSYLLFYTPMKPVTVLNTWVGAIPGALPPLIGWTSAAWVSGGSVRWPGEPAAWAGLLEPAGWSLFALMVVWQIPHFLAIAWMYREDYARGGFRMLPIRDSNGTLTALTIVLWAALLIPAALSPWWLMPTRLSWLYGGVALLTGVAYLAGAVRLIADCTPQRARGVFLMSIIHLPLLLMALVADGLLRAWHWT